MIIAILQYRFQPLGHIPELKSIEFLSDLTSISKLTEVHVKRLYVKICFRYTARRYTFWEPDPMTHGHEISTTTSRDTFCFQKCRDYFSLHLQHPIRCYIYELQQGEARRADERPLLLGRRGQARAAGEERRERRCDPPTPNPAGDEPTEREREGGGNAGTGTLARRRDSPPPHGEEEEVRISRGGATGMGRKGGPRGKGGIRRP